MTKENKQNDRLIFRAYIPEAPHLRRECEDGMFYQLDKESGKVQYLSSFIRRIYDQYGVNHPRDLGFDLEDRLDQSTGSRDKNKILMYEGDIITCQCYPFYADGKLNYVGEIIWANSMWYVDLHTISKRVGGCAIGGGLDEYDDCEIIGNIHQNGDLFNA